MGLWMFFYHKTTNRMRKRQFSVIALASETETKKVELKLIPLTLTTKKAVKTKNLPYIFSCYRNEKLSSYPEDPWDWFCLPTCSTRKQSNVGKYDLDLPHLESMGYCIHYCEWGWKSDGGPTIRCHAFCFGWNYNPKFHRKFRYACLLCVPAPSKGCQLNAKGWWIETEPLLL